MVRERMQLAVALFPQWVSLELGPAVTFGVAPWRPICTPRALGCVLHRVRGPRAGLLNQPVRVPGHCRWCTARHSSLHSVAMGVPW